MSQAPTDTNPRFFDLVGDMRAMRRLKPDPIPQALLDQVLEAGVQAPSGQNTQPWKFLVLRESDGKAWFARRYKDAIETRFPDMSDADKIASAPSTKLNRQLRALRYQMDHMHKFPVLLIVCGLRDWPFKVPPEERVGLAPPNYGAIYPCVQNILLACRAVGLGAALTTMHQVFEDELHERFAIPHEYGVVVTIPIGYPLGNFGPVRRKPAAASTYYDRWGAEPDGSNAKS
ncbi:MAG: nitroreductase family protein [Pseudomonadota bacterium]